MDALVTAAGGDDSILVSTSVYRLVCRPFKVLKLDKADCEDHLSIAILAGSDTRIDNLIQEFKLYLSQNELILNGLTEISLLVSQQIQACMPKSLPISLPLNSPVSSNSPALQNSGKHSGPSAQKPKPRTQLAFQPKATGPPTPTDSTISFSYITLILWEACNHAYSLLPANETLFNALCQLSLCN